MFINKLIEVTMKKFFLIALAAVMGIGLASAQDTGCLILFPTEKGAQLVTQSYDGNNNLLSTTTYTVGDAYQNYYADNAEIGYTTVDAMGNVIEQGTMETSCQDDNFYMKSVNRASLGSIQTMIPQNIEFMGNFLDYPNTFASGFPYDQTFEMDGGEFKIQDKNDKKEFMRVKVYNRRYEKNEKVDTPVHPFNAAKITYDVDVYDSNTRQTTTFKGIEWYSYKACIVRSEVYDENNNLAGCSVLSSMSKDYYNN